VPPADVVGGAEQLRVVGPHVEQHRQGARRGDASDERVELQLADGDAHPSGALVPDAEDPFAVGDDDHVHVAVGPAFQQRVDPLPEGEGDEDSAGSPIDV
jgi:hypothetical protein